MPNLKVLAELLDIPELATMDEHVDGYEQRGLDHIGRAPGAASPRHRRMARNLRGNGIWAGPVYSYADLLEDPQVRHNGSFVTYDHPTEGTVTTPRVPLEV